jgi:hypothetical protein
MNWESTTSYDLNIHFKKLKKLTMKKKNIIILTSVFTLLICWTACNKKEQAVAPPLPGNEPLTTLILKATNANDATDTPSASCIQLDPTGTNPPDTSHATLHLKSGASYNVVVQLLDSLNDITSEIKDRENYHLFCFDGECKVNCVRSFIMC